MESLNSAGYACVHQPLIDIVPVSNDPVLKQCMMNLDEYHTIISVSANASRIALDWLDQYWPQTPVGIEWLAVGPTSAAVFESIFISPKTPELAKTEGMLAMDALQRHRVAGQKILILRGKGGRETLANTLTERGATVHYAELYERSPVPLARGELLALCQQHQINLAVLTSGDLVKQFIDQLNDSNRLADITLVVPSERVAAYAEQLGASKVALSEGADTQSVMKCLQMLVEA